VGFPHSATTYIFKYLVEKYKEDLAIFEPFNPDIAYYEIDRRSTAHYSEGTVRLDYYKLPEKLKSLIKENSFWLIEWTWRDNPSAPYGGEYMWEIIQQLKDLPQSVIVKDVTIWVYLPELVSKYPDIKFIVPVREPKAILKDFEYLYQQASKHGRKSVLHPRWGLGLCLFYRYFHGVRNYPRDFSVETMRRVFDEMYLKYLELVGKVRYKANALVVRFGWRLEERKIANL